MSRSTCGCHLHERSLANDSHASGSTTNKKKIQCCTRGLGLGKVQPNSRQVRQYMIDPRTASTPPLGGPTPSRNEMRQNRRSTRRQRSRSNSSPEKTIEVRTRILDLDHQEITDSQSVGVHQPHPDMSGTPSISAARNDRNINVNCLRERHRKIITNHQFRAPSLTRATKIRLGSTDSRRETMPKRVNPAQMTTERAMISMVMPRDLTCLCTSGIRPSRRHLFANDHGPDLTKRRAPNGKPCTQM
jgi:hypothetical protein